MFAYILLLVCACALAEGTQYHPPKYVEALGVTNKAIGVLQRNIMSMASGIPFLMDPRRHYAEVVHVVRAQADLLYCPENGVYDKVYPKELNRTAGLGITSPQMVMDRTAKLLKLVKNKTDKIRALIEVQCKNIHPQDCDQVVDEEVKADPKRYKDEAKSLMLVADTAGIFMAMEPTFALAAKHHSTHKYMVEGQAALKGLVLSAVDMMRNLEHRHC